ncbi:MAG: SIS domain-containing protein [Ignavibacteriaceae bacterium]
MKSSYFSISDEELIQKGAILTAKEITNQPELWLKVYKVVLENYKGLKSFFEKVHNGNNGEELEIILSGAGSSAYIGDVLEGVFRKYSATKTIAVATTELVTHPDYFFQKNKKTLLISFARSGNSPESVKTVALANKLCSKIYHIVITCNSEGELARSVSGDNSFVLLMPPEADDKSLVMSGSFTSMLLSGLLLARLNELENLEPQIRLLAEYGKKIIKENISELKIISDLDFKRAVFLGSGIFKGIAEESALKLQELTDGKIICKHDSFLGFRHGPKALINADTLIVYLFSNNTYVMQYEKDLVKAVDNGRKALCSIGVMEMPVNEMKLDLKIKMICGSVKLEETFLSIVSVLPAQILGFLKSMNLGLKPDTPSESGMITRVVQGVKIYPFEE